MGIWVWPRLFSECQSLLARPSQTRKHYIVPQNVSWACKRLPCREVNHLLWKHFFAKKNIKNVKTGLRNKCFVRPLKREDIYET